ncbi:hypothetical protein BATDEDRAFT_85603 [Batrachochytrium dendrobatidis JAM81]|uniref:Uncharacterized protein n=1 Tax=Batrachochytrium dendrobatidis (strain JAM81 / FGSC 10211) TaxID=684364 RepID=F4NS76_BATDJ|nr:uncharacterized protein BATDEDRAFT_85603 [Batrachochytrium dendrobatidis JAM81]EGF83801.1 hypothetical protein BATDEDRAFT_85603 [Batrachochytrium dendrobatidis JAM81]|eukprot:XP_006676231.1 hypothetical protein BATDEDRAFT_85603 [Batrachochytrium dendrobatidis JAM81]
MLNSEAHIKNDEVDQYIIHKQETAINYANLPAHISSLADTIPLPFRPAPLPRRRLFALAAYLFFFA